MVMFINIILQCYVMTDTMNKKESLPQDQIGKAKDTQLKTAEVWNHMTSSQRKRTIGYFITDSWISKWVPDLNVEYNKLDVSVRVVLNNLYSSKKLFEFLKGQTK